MTKRSPIPHMSANEIVYLLSFLSSQTEMLEIGTGNSTPFFAKFVKSLVGIEHNKEWIEEVKKMVAVHSKWTDTQFIHVAPNWPQNHPFNPAEPGQFENYVNRIKELPHEKFDVILVDGRDRVNCTKAAVHALRKGGVLFIHDYWNRRNKYGEVESIEALELLNLDMKDRKEFTLVAFRKK